MTAPASQLRGLRTRGEFLNAARGNRAGRAGFSLQAVERAEPLPGIGFTVSKKVGNAPERNRVKRRLRAAVRACAQRFQPQHDYVLVGRREALSEPFDRLVGDLTALLIQVHARPARARPSNSQDQRKPA